MILTAHQPVYLPWLGLFHKIALADHFVSFNQVQYSPKEWHNRNQVQTPVGPKWLTVPVLRKGYLDNTMVDIRINNDVPWRRKHWNSLLGNYKKAPHFARYADFFEDAYSRHWDKLVDLNEYMLKWFIKTLGIKTAFSSAGDYNFKGEKSDLVLDMCRTLKTDFYIFGTLGRNYADVAAFNDAGIEVAFQDYNHPTYPQLHEGFQPHLSIVDLLFNCGEDSFDILMQGNINRAGLMPAVAS